MKKIIKTVLNFIGTTISFLSFLLELFFKGRFSNLLKNTSRDTVAILANGPSLKEVLPKLETNPEFKEIDFIVLNFFAMEPIFQVIKPKHYCLADPMFFYETHNLDKVRKLFEMLDEVSWKMNLYILGYRYSQFMKFKGKLNPNITVKPINEIEYKGFESLRNLFYAKGLAAPKAYTVAITAIYVALRLGYSNINLYGVDHTFFDGLTVNEENQLCYIEKHFYDEKEQKQKPIIRNDNSEPFKISDYLINISLIFKNHEYLESLSKYLNSTITNHTKNSLIDCYKRVEQ